MNNNITWRKDNNDYVGSIYEQDCLYIEEIYDYGFNYKLYIFDDYVGEGSQLLEQQKIWLEKQLIEYIERRDLFVAIKENNFESEYLFNLLKRDIEALIIFKYVYKDMCGKLIMTDLGKEGLKKLRRFPRIIYNKNEIKKLIARLEL